MPDAVSLLSELLPSTPWAIAAFFVARTILVNLRAYVWFEEILADCRLTRAIRRLKTHGGKQKQIQRLIEEDHRRRSGRSP